MKFLNSYQSIDQNFYVEKSAMFDLVENILSKHKEIKSHSVDIRVESNSLVWITIKLSILNNCYLEKNLSSLEEKISQSLNLLNNAKVANIEMILTEIISNAKTK